VRFLFLWSIRRDLRAVSCALLIRSCSWSNSRTHSCLLPHDNTIDLCARLPQFLENFSGYLMARLPVSGVTISAPLRSEWELGEVLEQLCPEVSFDKIQIHKIYIDIGRLHASRRANPE